MTHLEISDGMQISCYYCNICAQSNEFENPSKLIRSNYAFVKSTYFLMVSCRVLDYVNRSDNWSHTWCPLVTLIFWSQKPVANVEGDPKNVHGNPILTSKFHSEFRLAELNFSVKCGCQSIRFPYMFFESAKIIEDS